MTKSWDESFSTSVECLTKTLTDEVKTVFTQNDEFKKLHWKHYYSANFGLSRFWCKCQTENLIKRGFFHRCKLSICSFDERNWACKSIKKEFGYEVEPRLLLWVSFPDFQYRILRNEIKFFNWIINKMCRSLHWDIDGRNQTNKYGEKQIWIRRCLKNMGNSVLLVSQDSNSGSKTTDFSKNSSRKNMKFQVGQLMNETEQVITHKDDFRYWHINFNSNLWGSRTTKSLMQGSKWKIHSKNISYWVSKFWLSLCWINSNFRLLKEYFWSSRFLRTNGSFLLSLVCRSFNAWNKTNNLSKELSGGNLMLSNEILMETIKLVVTHKSDSEFWHQIQKSY